MNEQPHFSWCDPTRCSAGRSSSPYYSHRSREFRGTFDPDSDTSINVSLVQFLRRHTLFLLEFCNTDAKATRSHLARPANSTARSASTSSR
jgi:hypothetical protein